MKSLVFRIFALMLALGVSGVVAEVAVRFITPQQTGPSNWSFDKQLGLIPDRYQKGRRTIPGIFSYQFSHNSLGFRGSREYLKEKQVDLRLFFVGDSFTYGWGVNDEETMAARVEQRLKKAGKSLEVINAGNPGKGTDYAVRALQIYGPLLKPDVVLYVFYSNDFGDNLRHDYFKITDEQQIIPRTHSGVLEYKDFFLFSIPGLYPVYNWLISWSHVANLGKRFFISGLDHFTSRHKIGAPSENEPHSEADMKKVSYVYLSHLRDQAKKMKSRLLVGFLPAEDEFILYKDQSQVSPNEKLFFALLADLNIVHFSFTPVLAASEKAVGDLYYPNERHWTPEAHALGAEFLLPYIVFDL